jgi:hypothetical protein
MLYKFKSSAAGDVIMMGPTGDAVLRAMGREPSPQGIIEVADMAGAMAALERATAEDEAARAPGDQDAGGDDDKRRDPVALRHRVWPLIEMMKRSSAANAPIVWGV